MSCIKDDVNYLINNVTDKEILAAEESYLAMSDSPQRNRALHIRNQILTDGKLLGILIRVKRLLDLYSGR